MKNMRAIRKSHGLTMRQLGETIGASESSISLYETGKQSPDITMLCRIADALHVSTDELLGRADDPRKLSETDIRIALTDGEDAITPAQYAEVKQFVRFVRERDSHADK